MIKLLVLYYIFNNDEYKIPRRCIMYIKVVLILKKMITINLLKFDNLLKFITTTKIYYITIIVQNYIQGISTYINVKKIIMVTGRARLIAKYFKSSVQCTDSHSVWSMY
jgi:hypothetical protein